MKIQKRLASLYDKTHLNKVEVKDKEKRWEERGKWKYLKRGTQLKCGREM